MNRIHGFRGVGWQRSTKRGQTVCRQYKIRKILLALARDAQHVSKSKHFLEIGQFAGSCREIFPGKLARFSRHSLNYLWGKLDPSLVIVIFVVKLVKWLRAVSNPGRLRVFSYYGQPG